MDRPPRAPVSTRSPFALLVRRLRAIGIIDVNSLNTTVPLGGWIALVLVAVVVVVFGVFRLGIRDIYTESFAFLLAAMALAYLSRGVGLVLTLSFGLVDLIMSVVAPTPYTDLSDNPLALIGRLISWWLLWLLLATIPTLQRQVRARLAGAPHRSQPVRLLAVPLSALLAAGLTFLWSNAQPYLIRPVFSGEPQSPAMLPQQLPVQLALAAGIFALVLGFAYHMRAKSPTDFISLVDLGQLSGRNALTARVIVYGLALVAILGLLTSPLDPLILVVAFVVAELLAGVVGATPALREPLGATPLWARLLAGLAATFIVAQIVTSALRAPMLGSEFFPMVLSMAIGLVIFRVLVTAEVTPMSARHSPRTGSAIPAAALLLVAGLAAATTLLASPLPVAADNCGGLTDCLNGWWAQVGAAVSAIVAFLWSLITAIFEKTPPLISDLEPLASEEGAAMEFGALEMLQNRVATDVLNETGDTDEYYRIRGLTPAEFADEARTGKWDGLGRRAPYVGGISSGASG